MVLTVMDIKDLAQLSKQLNTSTDDLNAQLKSIEDRVNGLSLGVEAWVVKRPLHQVVTDVSTTRGYYTRERAATEVGYYRFVDGWHLAVRTISYPQSIVDSSDTEWDESKEGAEIVAGSIKPLLRASRTLRTLAVERIPDLVAALHAAATETIKAVEQARKISESLE